MLLQPLHAGLMLSVIPTTSALESTGCQRFLKLFDGQFLVFYD
jgi:hypothetical protein